MVICKDPRVVLQHLDKYFKVKDDSIQPLNIYLGRKLKPAMMPSGKFCWGQSTSKYVQEAVCNLEDWLKERNSKLPTRCDTPMSTSYQPELDTSEQLDAEMTNYYQSAIGVLRWAVELGHIDITTEVSMLASQMALPRIGHLNTVLHVFAYLKCKHNSRIVFDPKRLKYLMGPSRSTSGSTFMATSQKHSLEMPQHQWAYHYGSLCMLMPTMQLTD